MSRELAVNFEDSKIGVLKPDPIKITRSNYIITDFFTNIEEVARNDILEPSEGKSKLNKLLHSYHILNPSVWLVLMLLGFCSATLGFTIDYSSEKLLGFRKFLASSESGVGNLFIWVVYSMVFGAFAGACGKWISSDAEGSGIPEMKSILAGVHLSKYLSFPTFFSKILGLVAASAAGLSIGKEGPFVHVSAIIGNKLMKLGMFKSLHDNLTIRNQILAASVAAGVASTFGAPIGGVLFSIEVTATYYIVNNLWKGIFCAIFCVISFTLLHMTEVTDLINLTDFEPFELNLEILCFALLGLFCGVVGALFVNSASKLILMRVHRKFPKVHSRFRYIFYVTLACALITFSTQYLQLSDKVIINEMFRADNLTTYENADWGSPSIALNLLIYFLAKIIQTAFSISLQIPCGVFTPVFTAGSAFGRFFGLVMDTVLGTEHSGVYAVVGAAALTSSVTHTISVAIIVFELTGQINYMLPMMVGVLISFAVSNGFSMSIYDVLLEMKGLPYLPALKPSRLYKYEAKDVMAERLTCLTISSTLRDLANTIFESGTALSKVPIVDNQMYLVSDVSVSNLQRYLIEQYSLESLHFSQNTRRELDTYFGLLSGSRDVHEELKKTITIEEHLGDSELNEFWSFEVDFEAEVLHLDKAPLSIPENTPLAKVHFLFIMLGLTQLYVVRGGKLVGIISRDSFINHN